jgi:hypothetical protein
MLTEAAVQARHRGSPRLESGVILESVHVD